MSQSNFLVQTPMPSSNLGRQTLKLCFYKTHRATRRSCEEGGRLLSHKDHPVRRTGLWPTEQELGLQTVYRDPLRKTSNLLQNQLPLVDHKNCRQENMSTLRFSRKLTFLKQTANQELKEQRLINESFFFYQI